MAASPGENDEDLLALLVSTPEKAPASLIQDVSERIRRDFALQDASAFKQVVRAAEALGFPLLDSMANDIVAAPTRSDPNFSLPAAFDTPEGNAHLDAATALLQCSNEEAVGWTLSTLIKATRASSDNISRFLGTPALLEKVLHYSCCQKIARLSIIGELLRLEQQDDDGATADHLPSIRTALNALDDTVVLSGTSLRRGLFRMLLAKIMMRQKAFEFQQLLPAKPLCKIKYGAAEEQHAAWQHLNAVLLQIQQAFQERERVTAMQVLSVLLYSRMSVTRQDLVLLLQVFQSNETWFTAPAAANRYPELPRLAGIIGVESMGLWRVVTEEVWVAEHPLMEGLFDPQQQEGRVKRELQVILSLLEKYLHQIPSRPATTNGGQVESPEALVTLAYGLLLKVAHGAILLTPEGSNSGAYWQNFNDDSLRLCQNSNGCNSFEYFYTVMLSLVPSLLPAPQTRQAIQTTPGANEESDFSPSALTYASIGRELLCTAVIAFESTLLSLDHDGACDNIGMLCNLATVVHQNSPVLCRRFWLDWETIYLADSEDQRVPIQRLLDKSEGLATKSRHGNTLRGIVPLLRMVAAVVYDAQSTEEVLTQFLPIGLIQKALSSGATTNVLPEQRHAVLSAFYVLSRTGNSAACREHLRNLLEVEGHFNTDQCNGPRMLVSLANDKTSAAIVLRLLAALAIDAPERWLLESTLHVRQSGMMSTDMRLDDDASFSIALASFFESVARGLNCILLSPSIEMEEKMAFLNAIEHAVQFCASILTASGSTTGGSPHPVPNVYETVHQTVKCVKSILAAFRPAYSNESQQILERISSIRSNLISLLARPNGLGGVILYFATLPVTMSLGSELHDHLQDSAALGGVDGGTGGSRPLFGQNPGDGVPNAVDFLAEKVDAGILNLEGAYAKGWLSNDDIPTVFQVAQEAIEFTTWWALTVEDMALEDSGLPLLALSPCHTLCGRSVLPVACRTHRAMLVSWSAVAPSFASLLLSYMGHSEPDALSAETVELLAICVLHCKRQQVVETLDETLFRVFLRSESFKKQMAKLFSELLPRSLAGGIDIHHETHTSRLVYGLMRIAATCVDLSSSMAICIVGKAPADFLSSMAKAVGQIMKEMERQDDKERERQNLTAQIPSSLLCKIELGCHCLSLVLSFWSLARNRGPVDMVMRSAIENGQELLLNLAGFLFRTGKTHLSKEPIFCCFSALTLDLLATEMVWAEGATNSEGKPRSFEVLESVDANRFLSTLMYQTDLTHFSPYCKAYSQLSNGLSGSLPCAISLSRLIPLLTTSSRLDESACAVCDGRAATDASAHSSSLETKVLPSSQLTGGLAGLAVANGNLRLESRRLVSWEMFLSTLLNKLRSGKTNNVTTFLDVRSASEGARVCATALLKHLENVKCADMEAAGSNLATAGLAMAAPLATCLLHLVELCGVEDEAWTDIMEDIGHCMVALLAINAISPSLVTHILSAVVALVPMRPKFAAADGKNTEGRANDAILKLVLSSCRFLNKVGLLSLSLDLHQCSLCLRVSMTFLSQVLVSLPKEQDSREHDKLMSKMFGIFVDCELVQTLCKQTALLFPTRVDGQGVGIGLEMHLSCLELLTTLASLGNSPFLSLLADCHVPGVMSRVSSMMKYRRASDGPDQVSFSSGGDDIIHKQYGACLRFLSAVLVATSNDFASATQNVSPFAILAVDFLMANKETVCKCLERCGGPSSFCLTLETLGEASLILSISAKLCSRSSLEYFSRTCHDLYGALLSRSNNMITTLSAFLGASAAAREHFAAVEADPAEAVDQRNRVNLASRLGGEANTKYEAVRFSRFREEHYETVTDEEKVKSETFLESLRPRKVDAAPDSLLHLEQTQRCSVYNQFAFELEHAVAACLFVLISFIRKTHPASAALVTFSPAEVARLDAFSWVRSGSTIAFRAVQTVSGQQQTTLAASGQLDIPSASLKYGKVVYADVLSRTWHVNVFGSKETVAVNESNLAGIEDATKLRSVLAYCPAPDSAKELGQSLTQPSVGHLILALRWCHNVFTIDCESAPWASQVCRLSELVSIFLANELSIHRKIGSLVSANKADSVSAMSKQVFDLFDTETSGWRRLQQSMPNRSLHAIMTSEVWRVACDQLQQELADPTGNGAE